MSLHYPDGLNRPGKRGSRLLIRPIEHRHVTDGSQPEEEPGGVGLVSVVAQCSGNALEVLSKVREVVLLVVNTPSTGWPSIEHWRDYLPDWFVDGCTEDISDGQAERWLAWLQTLKPSEKTQAIRDRGWSLPNWLYWLEPANRQWYWWDGKVSGDRVVVSVEVAGWPAPLGSLEWLLLVAGASSVSIQESPTT